MTDPRAPQEPMLRPPESAPVGEPEDPTDQPLLDVVSTLDDEGFGGQFRAEAGGVVRCLTCGSPFAASAIRADEVSRLEGASDPADMLMVIPLECPVCGVRGTLISNFGPEATAEEAEVLQAMRRVPAEGADRAEPTPGVT